MSHDELCSRAQVYSWLLFCWSIIVIDRLLACSVCVCVCVSALCACVSHVTSGAGVCVCVCVCLLAMPDVLTLDVVRVKVSHMHVGSVDKLTPTSSGWPLQIHGKNFLNVTFVIPKEKDCLDIYTSLTRLSQPGSTIAADSSLSKVSK